LQARVFHLSVFNGVLCIVQGATAALGDSAAEREAFLNKNHPMQLWLCHKADESDFEERKQFNDQQEWNPSAKIHFSLKAE
jgi:hypothetical protein